MNIKWANKRAHIRRGASYVCGVDPTGALQLISMSETVIHIKPKSKQHHLKFIGLYQQESSRAFLGRPAVNHDKYVSGIRDNRTTITHAPLGPQGWEPGFRPFVELRRLSDIPRFPPGVLSVSDNEGGWECFSHSDSPDFRIWRNRRHQQSEKLSPTHRGTST